MQNRSRNGFPSFAAACASKASAGKIRRFPAISRLFRPGLLILALLLAILTPASAQVPANPPHAGDYSFMDRSSDPADPLTVYLVTLSPGDAAYERFGHNMIHIIDHRTGQHVSFNFGVFDFEQKNFTWNFIQGRMTYNLAAYRGDIVLDMYIAEDRTVTLQELDLTPSQKSRLNNALWINSRKEFASYRYDYFKDNCSTRLRDVLDETLDGQLRKQTESINTGLTFRTESLRLSAGDWPLYYTLNILLGSPTDKPLTQWQAMFLPEKLMQSVADLKVLQSSGKLGPLVKNTQTLNTTSRPTLSPKLQQLIPVVLSLVMGLGGASLVYGLVNLSRKTGRRLPMWIAVIMGELFCLTCGIYGLIMTWVWFTDHTAGQWNPNWLMLNPLSLAMLILLPKRLLGQTEKFAFLARPASQSPQALTPPVLPIQAARCRRWANRIARVILLMSCIGSAISMLAGALPAVGGLMLLVIPWQMCLQMVVTFYRVPTAANPAPASKS